MKAILRKTRISPKKANLVAGIVRNKKVSEALPLLKFMPKKGAKILYDVIQSAASNAKNNFNQPFDDLVITKILVTKGPTMKRSLPISRGRMHPIRKRTSHITVEVGLPDEGEVKKVEVKRGVKKVETTDKKPVKKTAPSVKGGSSSGGKEDESKK